MSRRYYSALPSRYHVVRPDSETTDGYDTTTDYNERAPRVAGMDEIDTHDFRTPGEKRTGRPFLERGPMTSSVGGGGPKPATGQLTDQQIYEVQANLAPRAVRPLSGMTGQGVNPDVVGKNGSLTRSPGPVAAASPVQSSLAGTLKPPDGGIPTSALSPQVDQTFGAPTPTPGPTASGPSANPTPAPGSTPAAGSFLATNPPPVPAPTPILAPPTPSPGSGSGRLAAAGVSNASAAQFQQPTQDNPIPKTPTSPPDLEDYDKRSGKYSGF